MSHSPFRVRVVSFASLWQALSWAVVAFIVTACASAPTGGGGPAPVPIAPTSVAAPAKPVATSPQAQVEPGIKPITSLQLVRPSPEIMSKAIVEFNKLPAAQKSVDVLTTGLEKAVALQGVTKDNVRLDWKAATALTSVATAGSQPRVVIMAAPAVITQKDFFSPQNIAAISAAKKSVTFGAVVVAESTPDLAAGDYLLEWYPDRNTVALKNVATGLFNTGNIVSCKTSSSVLQPSVEVYEGSKCIGGCLDSVCCNICW